MDLSEEQRHDLDVALNEATLIGAEISTENRAAWLTRVLTLPPDDGPSPDDNRVQVLLGPVGRLAASLRGGRWDDASAPVEEFAVQRLLEIVMSFEGLAIYGWEFFDRPEADNFSAWRDRLSLDWRSAPAGLSHTLDLFQEGFDRHLDLRIWFDELRVFTPEHEELALDEFAAGGVRWWTGSTQTTRERRGTESRPSPGTGEPDRRDYQVSAVGRQASASPGRPGERGGGGEGAERACRSSARRSALVAGSKWVESWRRPSSRPALAAARDGGAWIPPGISCLQSNLF